MRHAAMLATGSTILAVLWLVPWQGILPGPFSAHMVRHVGIVAVAAPCLTIGIVGSRLDPVRRWPWLFPAVVASLVELVVVWAWHAPALHNAARQSPVLASLEQGSFLVVGMLVWVAALGGTASQRAARSGTGLIALLLTLMHMTLLGALIGLAPRPLYDSAAHGGLAHLLSDQHFGAALMLTVGAVSYLAGGLWLGAELLRSTAGVPSRMTARRGAESGV